MEPISEIEVQKYLRWLDLPISEAYPYEPGYKDADTSKAVAQSLDKDKIRQIHKNILNSIDGKTTEDVIDELWVEATTLNKLGYAKEYHAHALYIKPRITEMLRLGLIKDSGERRNGFSGNPSKVWVKC